MSAEALFLEHLGTIERVAAFVGRRNHLDASDIEEFAAQVKVDLIDNDYAIIRKFEGRSTFSTYLTTVIQRLFYEYRVRLWGKWRPSAEAKRLGTVAITVERMTTRDGFTFPEAVQILTTRADAPCSVPELEAIRLRLPARQPRPILVAEDSVGESVAAEAEDRVDLSERDASARAMASTLDRALLALPAEDQLILRMRFWQARRVADISVALQLDQKKLYKRIDRLLHQLRAVLEEAGIATDEVRGLLRQSDQELELSAFGEIEGERPSHSADGENEEHGAGRRTS